MRRRTLGRALVGTSVALTATAAAVMLMPAPLGANAPSKYGWWYKANAGLPVAVPPPPQVPSDGLYVENGFDGPSAISALSFSVPPGAALGPMTLKIAGSPTITQPPVACTLSAASSGYKPAEDGSWSDRPSYDCKKAQSTGSVDAAKTTVTFNVDPFLTNGTVSVVILAGGSADQIAFQKPDNSALQVNSGDAGGLTGSPGAGSGASTAPDMSAAAGSNVPAQPTPSLGGSSQGLADTGSGPLPAVPAAPSALAGPPAGTPSAASTGQGSPRYALARPASATAPQDWRTRTATVLGLTAVLAALVAWTLGYGPLGGRIEPLSVRVRPPSSPRE
ncbi:MAG: hypothetical protein E6G01_03800 [Actinobacteria bacterium]|nr:MAG: hypothetical protein E6G01_03800 [Actinomycetota bacterium]